jgi:hypothetical protein
VTGFCSLEALGILLIVIPFMNTQKVFPRYISELAIELHNTRPSTTFNYEILRLFFDLLQRSSNKDSRFRELGQKTRNQKAVATPDPTETAQSGDGASGGSKAERPEGGLRQEAYLFLHLAMSSAASIHNSIKPQEVQRYRAKDTTLNKCGPAGISFPIPAAGIRTMSVH